MIWFIRIVIFLWLLMICSSLDYEVSRVLSLIMKMVTILFTLGYVLFGFIIVIGNLYQSIKEGELF